MNKISFFVIIAGAILLSTSCCEPRYSKVNLQNSVDSISYALGYMHANSIKNNMFARGRLPFDSIDYKMLTVALTKYGVSKDLKEMFNTQFNEVNEDIYIKAFNNEMGGLGESPFDEMSANMYIQSEYERIRNKIANDNLEMGEKFLEENGNRSEVITLESGLQYEIITTGEGEIPTEEDFVIVHYHGTLLNGEVFDSSVERGEPSRFGTTQVIKGWQEALLIMPVGSKWKLYIPADLAYGQRGSRGIGKDIGPNEVLTFEVELLEIEEKNN